MPCVNEFSGPGEDYRMPERPNRKPDEACREKWGELVQYLGGLLKREQFLGPRHDVDSRFAETGSRLRQLEGLLRVPEIRAQAEKIWNALRAKPETGEVAEPGQFPTVDTILRRITEAHGPANRLEEYEHYTREFLGWRADYALQAIGLDATGLDVQVADGWGGLRADGKPCRWAFFMVDAASGRQWCHAPQCKSEQAGWPDASEWLFKQLPSAPEYLFADRISALFENLSALAPGEELLRRPKAAAPMGILALLACGVKIMVSKPETPTGKAFVERGIGVAKDHLIGLLCERAAGLEQAGRLPASGTMAAPPRGKKRRRRHFENEVIFQEAVRTLMDHVNNLPDFRGSGKTRIELCENHAASIEKRRTRALVQNPWETFLGIIRRAKVALLAGQEVFMPGTEDTPFARLNAPLAPIDSERPSGAPLAVCLAIPGGMLASDPAGLWRCYVIQKRQGLTKISYAEATAHTKGDFGYSAGLSPLGTYRLRPETETERQRHAAQAAAEKIEDTLAQQPAAARADKPAGKVAARVMPFDLITPEPVETLEERTARLAVR